MLTNSIHVVYYIYEAEPDLEQSPIPSVDSRYGRCGADSSSAAGGSYFCSGRLLR